MKKPFDVLVVGEINPDLILSGDVLPEFGQVEKWIDAADLTIGSSSVILACGVAKLGLSVNFCGLCGNDVFGHFMLDAMRAHHINVSAVDVRPDDLTGISIILNRKIDRAILTFPGLIPKLGIEDIPDDLFTKAGHLHVASYFLQTKLQPNILDLFSKARNHGLTISLDTNWDPSGEWKNFDQILAAVDIFLPNENEAMALTHTTSPQDALTVLSGKCDCVAVKMGADGAIASRKGETAQVQAMKMDVVDTVGAGDTFDSGFLYGYLHQWPLQKTLEFASICGSLSTRSAGGTQAQPTFDEVMQYVNR
jgi:sugar/nucleoside kinase (ribokinase family)